MTEKDTAHKNIMVGNGRYILRVSKDRMEAYLIPTEQQKDGPIADEGQLFKEIKLQGVVSGLLPKLLPGPDGTRIAAKGQEPVNGENARIVTHFTPSVARAPKTKQAGKDIVDFRELGNIVNVENGDLLLEKIMPTEGTPGLDVFGAEIKARPGKDLGIKVGEGVELSEDGLKVHARRAGKFLLAEGKPVVMEAHTINGDVDMSVGNVHFNGTSLTIQGEVMMGFTVSCRGDISVAKGVHNAQLTAGGRIEVRGGVVGEEAVLKAGGEIKVDFVENGVRVETAGSVFIQDCVVQGHFRVNGSLTAMQGKGAIIGGDYVIGGSMFVKALGSDAEVATEVSVGINPALEEKKKQLEAEKEIWPAKLNEVIKNVGVLKQMQKQLGKLPPDKVQLLNKLNGIMPQIMERVNLLTETEKNIQDEMAKLVNECIYVYGPAYPGVTVSIGKAVRRLTCIDTMVVIYFDLPSQQIHIRPMTSTERAASRD